MVQRALISLCYEDGHAPARKLLAGLALGQNECGVQQELTRDTHEVRERNELDRGV